MATPVRVRFRAFTRNNLQIRTSRILAQALALEIEYAGKLIDELKEYPSPLPNQQYVRTYELREHWRIQDGDPRIAPSGIICRIINDVQDHRGKYYATYVQGPWQTGIHQGRWLKATGDGDEENHVVRGLRRDFARKMRQIVRSNVRFV